MNREQTLRLARRLAYWYCAYVVFFAAGLLLLPLARTYPRFLHEAVLSLSEGPRQLILFAFSVATAFALTKVFNPRIRQLRRVHSHPPTWTAVVLAVASIAVIDLVDGLTANGPQSTWLDWLVYGACGSAVGIGLDVIPRMVHRIGEGSPNGPRTSDPPGTDAETLMQWLLVQRPAAVDYFGGGAVAERMIQQLRQGQRALGLVGPFGSGKSSVLNWFEASAQKSGMLVVKQSSWGFETAGTAVQALLRAAVERVREEVDPSQSNWLPDSYRKAVAGNSWLERLLTMSAPPSDPFVELAVLSRELSDLHLLLVFLIEDLDRNESHAFDIQEVLGFLARLRDQSQLAFVLAGGLGSTGRLDFAKLCDHVEYLVDVPPESAIQVIVAARDHCFDQQYFPLIQAERSDNRHLWTSPFARALSDYQEYSLAEASSLLLRTPRALRQALSSTDSAWGRLNGEVNWDQLFVLNVIRSGAPEAFDFLFQRWGRLHDRPGDRAAYAGGGQSAKFRSNVVAAWQQTTSTVDWNVPAALVLMDFLLPASGWWLQNSSRVVTPDVVQGLHEKRYWNRAVQGDVSPTEVRDQVVLASIEKWLARPDGSDEMLERLYSSQEYGEVWLRFAPPHFFGQSDKVRDTCSRFFTFAIEKDGASASGRNRINWVAQEFSLPLISQDEQNAAWLKAEIDLIVASSVALAADIAHALGISPSTSIVEAAARGEIRIHLAEAVRALAADPERFCGAFSENAPYGLFRVIQDVDRNAVDASVDWIWLGDAVITALGRGSTALAVNLSHVIGTVVRTSDSSRISWDPHAASLLFGTRSGEARALLMPLAERVESEFERNRMRSLLSSRVESVADSSGGDLPTGESD